VPGRRLKWAMDFSVYEVEAGIEAEHWWFVGRRRLLARELRTLGASKQWRVLDLGCGTGGSLRLLNKQGFAALVGMDASPVAAAFCARKGLASMVLGNATRLPFSDGTFDLVLAMDVLEHVDHDDLAAAEISRVLQPSGAAIITVPAFQALWGPQDELSHHLRRYRLAPLCEMLSSAGLNVARAYYFNFLLFLPIFTARLILRATKTELRSENEINWPVVNSILRCIFAVDVDFAPSVRPPFGVSICAVVRKQQVRTPR